MFQFITYTRLSRQDLQVYIASFNPSLVTGSRVFQSRFGQLIQRAGGQISNDESVDLTVAEKDKEHVIQSLVHQFVFS